MKNRAASKLLVQYASGQKTFTEYDLSGQCLADQVLDGLVLRNVDLRGADLSGALLRGARFIDCRMGPRVVCSTLRATAHALFGVLSGFILFFSSTFAVDFVAAQSQEIPLYGGLIAFLWLPYFLVSVYRTGLTPFTGAMSAAVSLLAASSGVSVGLLSVYEALMSAGIVILAIAGPLSGSIVLVALLSLLTLMPITMLCISASLGRSALIGVLLAVMLGLMQLKMHKPLIGGTMVLVWFIARFLAKKVNADDPRFYWLYHFVTKLQVLGGTCLEGTDLTDTDLSNLSLSGVDFSRAKLCRTVFRSSKHSESALFHNTVLQSANLRRLVVSGTGDGLLLPRVDMKGISLRHATLRSAQMTGCLLADADLGYSDLTGANLADANLERASLVGAQLSQANLRGANLRGTNLFKANFSEALLSGAIVDYETCKKSKLSIEELESLRELGVLIYNLNEFPEAHRSRLIGIDEGLTLYFNTRLTPFNRHMIDGVIYAILGAESRCEVSHFVNREESAMVRLSGPRSDLELVAEVLYRKLWEAAAQEHEQAILRRVQGMLSATIRTALSELVEDRLSRIELRQHRPAAGTMDLVVGHDGTACPELVWAWNYKSNTIKTAGHLHVAIISAQAKDDQELKNRLIKHFSIIEKQGLARFHSMTDALAGDEVASFWSSQLINSSIVLILVSPDLFASEECSQQISQVLHHHAGKARVIPILLRPSDWKHSWLQSLKPLPESEIPIICWENKDAGLLDIVSGVRHVLLGLV